MNSEHINNEIKTIVSDWSSSLIHYKPYQNYFEGVGSLEIDKKQTIINNLVSHYKLHKFQYQYIYDKLFFNNFTIYDSVNSQVNLLNNLRNKSSSELCFRYQTGYVPLTTEVKKYYSYKHLFPNEFTSKDVSVDNNIFFVKKCMFAKVLDVKYIEEIKRLKKSNVLSPDEFQLGLLIPLFLMSPNEIIACAQNKSMLVKAIYIIVEEKCSLSTDSRVKQLFTDFLDNMARDDVSWNLENQSYYQLAAAVMETLINSSTSLNNPSYMGYHMRQILENKNLQLCTYEALGLDRNQTLEQEPNEIFRLNSWIDENKNKKCEFNRNNLNVKVELFKQNNEERQRDTRDTRDKRDAQTCTSKTVRFANPEAVRFDTSSETVQLPTFDKSKDQGSNIKYMLDRFIKANKPRSFTDREPYAYQNPNLFSRPSMKENNSDMIEDLKMYNQEDQIILKNNKFVFSIQNYGLFVAKNYYSSDNDLSYKQSRKEYRNGSMNVSVFILKNILNYHQEIGKNVIIKKQREILEIELKISNMLNVTTINWEDAVFVYNSSGTEKYFIFTLPDIESYTIYDFKLLFECYMNIYKCVISYLKENTDVYGSNIIMFILHSITSQLMTVFDLYAYLGYGKVVSARYANKHYGELLNSLKNNRAYQKTEDLIKLQEDFIECVLDFISDKKSFVVDKDKSSTMFAGAKDRNVSCYNVKTIEVHKYLWALYAIQHGTENKMKLSDYTLDNCFYMYKENKGYSEPWAQQNSSYVLYVDGINITQFNSIKIEQLFVLSVSMNMSFMYYNYNENKFFFVPKIDKFKQNVNLVRVGLCHKIINGEENSRYIDKIRELSLIVEKESRKEVNINDLMLQMDSIFKKIDLKSVIRKFSNENTFGLGDEKLKQMLYYIDFVNDKTNDDTFETPVEDTFTRNSVKNTYMELLAFLVIFLNEFGYKVDTKVSTTNIQLLVAPAVTKSELLKKIKSNMKNMKIVKDNSAVMKLVDLVMNNVVSFGINPITKIGGGVVDEDSDEFKPLEILSNYLSVKNDPEFGFLQDPELFIKAEQIVTGGKKTIADIFNEYIQDGRSNDIMNYNDEILVNDNYKHTFSKLSMNYTDLQNYLENSINDNYLLALEEGNDGLFNDKTNVFQKEVDEFNGKLNILLGTPEFTTENIANIIPMYIKKQITLFKDNSPFSSVTQPALVKGGVRFGYPYYQQVPNDFLKTAYQKYKTYNPYNTGSDFNMDRKLEMIFAEKDFNSIDRLLPLLDRTLFNQNSVSSNSNVIKACFKNLTYLEHGMKLNVDESLKTNIMKLVEYQLFIDMLIYEFYITIEFIKNFVNNLRNKLGIQFSDFKLDYDTLQQMQKEVGIQLHSRKEQMIAFFKLKLNYMNNKLGVKNKYESKIAPEDVTKSLLNL